MKTSSSNFKSILEKAVLRSAGVDGNPYLAGGFLIGSSLLGLLVIIGAFWYNRNNLSLFKRFCVLSCSQQHNRIMGVQVIYNTMVCLFVMDAMNLIAAVIFGATMVTLSCSDGFCFIIENAWVLFRWFGVIIHLVNASLCIYHLHQPLSAARLRFIYSLVSLPMMIVVPLFLYATETGMFILATFMFLFALAFIVTSRAPTSSPSTDTLKKRIVVVAMYNFLVVYVPAFILECILISSHDDKLKNYAFIYVNVLVYTNLHLIFDGLQRALILKFPSGEQQQQELQQW